MIRQIVSPRIAYANRTKAASSFIADFTSGTFLEPQIVKISDSDAFKLFRGNEWVFATVNRIANDCTKILPRVAPKDMSKKINASVQKRIELVQEFLDDPNENKESFADIRGKFIRDLLVMGRGCVEKVVSKISRRLAEVYAVPSRYVKIKVNTHGMMPDTRAYEQTDPKSGDTVAFAKDEMIFIVLNPSTETVYGIKPLDALANAVAADILRAAYNHNFFINGAEAAGILSLEGMNKAELKKFREYWQSAHKGAAKSHKVAAVNVPVKWMRMALTNRDIEFSEYGIELRTKIFAVYGMQPMVMGVVDPNTGRLNSQEQTQAYKDGALKPILNKESYAYTKEIVQDGFGFSDIKISFAEVDLADAVEQAKIDREDLGSSILTINEIRARRGLPPVKWGDTPLVVLPGGGQVDPDTGRLTIPSKTPDKNPDKKPKGKDDKETMIAKNLIDSYFILVRDDKTVFNGERIEKFPEILARNQDEEKRLKEYIDSHYGTTIKRLEVI